MKLNPNNFVTILELVQLIEELGKDATLIDLLQSLKTGLVEGSLGDGGEVVLSHDNTQGWQDSNLNPMIRYTGTDAAITKANEIVDNINNSPLSGVTAIVDSIGNVTLTPK